MRKIGIALISAVMLLSSVAFASPLTDYSAGKGSIDLTWRNTENTLTGSGHSYDFDKKYNLDGSVTLGLGHKFAFQYRYFDPVSKQTIYPNYNLERNSIGTLELKTNEFNVLYKLDKNVSLYAGVLQAKGIGSNSFYPSEVTIDKGNLGQIGVIGSTKVASKTILWGSAAVGKDLTNWEVGLSYEVAKNLEVGVNYRDLKIKNFSNNNSTKDIQAKGLGLGLTYKF